MRPFDVAQGRLSKRHVVIIMSSIKGRKKRPKPLFVERPMQVKFNQYGYLKELIIRSGVPIQPDAIIKRLSSKQRSKLIELFRTDLPKAVSFIEHYK
jgi:hypothetical protein